MDYETIDNFKLSRFVIILNQLFNFSLFKSKSGFSIADLGSVAIGLVVAAVILGMGATILETLNESSGLISSTANTSISPGMVGTLAEVIPTIAIIAVAAIVIGVVLVFFGRSHSYSENEETEDDEDEDDEKLTDSDGYTSISKFKSLEDKYNREYFKVEPDFDDAKKSVWDRIFKKRYKK